MSSASLSSSSLLLPALGSPWNTPQILQAGFVAVVVTSLVFMLAAITGARSHRHNMQVIGKDSAPSIIAAQHIGSALADMDANAANELLDPGGAAASRAAFEERRTEGTEAIVTAAQNITYGDAERVPILKLAAGTGAYVARVQQARDFRAANNPKYVEAYREASRYMDGTLLPAAADLDKANRSILDQAYASAEVTSGLALGFLIVSAGLLGASLLGLQLFLSRRMRRLLNPMLLLATAIALIFTIYAAHSFRAESRELKIAKEDAFESIHALWQARSLAFSANSDESRYLLNPAEAAVNEKSFGDKADRIARLPAGVNQLTVLNDVTAGRHVDGLSGYLPDELSNITFPGERDAAASTLGRFLQYVEIDRRMRALERNKEHQAAIAICVGNGAGQSNYAFNRFQEALGLTLNVNQRAFDASVAAGTRAVAGFEVTSPLVAFAIAGFSWLGLRQRLREYSE